ncbi:hypothetical protein HN858_01640 [Candidatus Falkowbacteria bacterium]|jgi:uncharacterized protein (TIGR00661 family)|nr:hypothetical protein [Candidatus Falkowbacteria bacterium]MBT6573946.1 hypothetical protein [Candidatus Falkowbacteria bacterium]MBT7348356.1 hypothetical protein [Candidatus Falkowbacteria bacterium]MBT7500259.1 hypothetical protein [Candidatus Falkowbacteria bacterium]
MAKIIYSLAGQGAGHGSRSKEIIAHLVGEGHELKILSYNQGYDLLKKFFKVEKIFGLTFDYHDNQVRILPTVYKNALRLPQAKASLQKILKLINSFKPDLIITDFEPLACIAANLKRVPLVSIDNQHALTDTIVKYPREHEKDATLAKAVTKLLIFNTKINLVISFFKTKPKNKKTFVFSPILRSEVLQAKPKQGDYILVYVTSPSHDLEKVLLEVNCKFICYGFNKEGKQKNLLFKKPSKDKFFLDLANSKAVIANTGFTLIGEALHLGKPYLAWPVRSQFEQILNALYIEKSGYGLHADQLDMITIKKFLKSLPKYRRKVKKYPRQDNRRILKKVDQVVATYS